MAEEENKTIIKIPLHTATKGEQHFYVGKVYRKTQSGREVELGYYADIKFYDWRIYIQERYLQDFIHKLGHVLLALTDEYHEIR